jgi:hypothetical protein
MSPLCPIGAGLPPRIKDWEHLRARSTTTKVVLAALASLLVVGSVLFVALAKRKGGHPPSRVVHAV